MRLTLRTLLAYLDDVLPAEQAKELGKKLGESNYATALVDRIKEVMRRRRLSAPELFGKGAAIDPNVMADYLDNELSPNDVSDVEKICLDSDVHLAEVAACHQILTLVLGEPVDVRPETRSRMYALGPVPAAESFRAEDEPAISMGTGPRIGAGVEPVVTASSHSELDRTIPDYLKPKATWQRKAFMVMLLLVVGGWVGLLLLDPTLNPGKGKSNSATSPDLRSQKQELVQKPDVPAERQERADDSAQTEPGKAIVANSKVDGNEPNAKPRIGNVQPVEIADAGRAAPGEAPLNAPITRRPRVEDDLANGEKLPNPEAPAQPAEPQAIPPIRMLYSTRDGRLLHWSAKASDFLVLPNRTELKPDDRLACPEPFRAEILVGDEVAQATLIGGTAVTLLKATEQARIGFEVSQGVIVFESRSPAAEPDADTKPAAAKPLSISLLMRGQAHRLELASDDAICAIEVRRGEPVRFQTAPEAPGYSAALHVAAGSVKFTANGKTESYTGPTLVPLTADWGTPKPGELSSRSSSTSPDWFDTDPRRAATRPKPPYKTAFEKEFDPDQPLQLTIPAIVNNPRPALSELAVKCLGLTESYQPLVKALIAAEHREARLAAITGLRQWLPLTPEHEAQLQAELENHVPSHDAEALVRLLWGYSQADGKNPTASRQLVGWLDHDQVAIRELAYFHIQRLTGVRSEYTPVANAAQRRAAIERWHTHIEKRGGALIAQ